MPKDDRVYLGHMFDTARKAQSFIEGKTRVDFDADEPLRIALAHLLQVIGEAARHISQEFQQEHLEVPWSLIIGMRHKVVHDYMNIDEDVVWNTVNTDLPPLVASLALLISPEEDN